MRIIFICLMAANGFQMKEKLSNYYNEPAGLSRSELIINNQGPINETILSWNKAIDTMSYHRSMMNEYLCRNFVANEIIEALQNKSKSSVDRRMGNPFRKAKLERDSLLEDQGSKHYKDWLSRSTTLEDIYRHYENLAEAEDAPVQSLHPGDGEVTGYAMVGPKVATTGHSGYGAGTSYGVPEYEHKEEDEHDEKGMKLKELFQLALTAIAFLAFGTFIIEVIMCVMGLHNMNNNMMMVSPSQFTQFSNFQQLQHNPSYKLEEELANQSNPPNQRQQRAFPFIDIPVEVLNAMTSKVLSSIEAFAILQEDNGLCLRRVLCESNKYSRSLSGFQRIWLPLWSFGASYVAGRLMKKSETLNSDAMLEFLKSSIFGLGNADCEKMYPNCNAKLRRKRRKRESD